MSYSTPVAATEASSRSRVDSRPVTGRIQVPSSIASRLGGESGDDLFTEILLSRDSNLIFEEESTPPDGEFEELVARFPDRDDEPIEGLTAEQFELEGTRHPERYNFLVRWLAKAAKSGEIKRIIDAGAGPAFLTSLLFSQWRDARVIAVDRSPDMVQLASERLASTPIEVVESDIRRIREIRSGDVDAIVSRRMIHRVDDLHAVLHSMVSTLRPGGVLVNYSFRTPGTPLGREAFLRAAAIRESHPHLHAAYVRAVVNAPSLEDYRAALLEVATKLQVKSVRLKIYPFDLGIIIER